MEIVEKKKIIVKYCFTLIDISDEDYIVIKISNKTFLIKIKYNGHNHQFI
jgi:hypothetical protein